MGRKISTKFFYVVYDTTEYELPVAVFEDLHGLGKFFKRSAKDISASLCKIRQGKKNSLLVDHKYYTVERYEFA